ncbi:MAG TPA: nitrilase-related carbon-nitrogen hydrolase, partial [Burkholderiales bacterium]|nr:nitrilase-related carbon-nitrogen hydrolase [Burkholderiales bacterium]
MIFKVAAIQMVSGPDVTDNLAHAARLIQDAVRQGASLVALPEYFCLMGMADTDKVGVREEPGKGPIQEFLSKTAAEHGIWLIGGTVPLTCEDAARVRNSLLVYDDKGRCVVRYDKIHLFGFDNGIEAYREANTIEAGDAPQAVQTPYGRVGLSICYDLRFPELYRK